MNSATPPSAPPSAFPGTTLEEGRLRTPKVGLGLFCQLEIIARRKVESSSEENAGSKLEDLIYLFIFFVSGIPPW